MPYKVNGEANVSDAKVLTPEEIAKVKEMTLFSQQAVNYTTLSAQQGQACANCIFYRSTGYDGIDWPHCHIVDGWPKPIEPTGWCDEWRAVPDPEPLNQEPIPVVIVEPTVIVEDTAEAALPTDRKGLADFIIDTMNKVLHPTPKGLPAFSVFKSASGKKYWISRHTGKFKDRESEIIANKAHDEYVERVQKGLVPMPELWTFHKKGTRHGEAFFVWKSGGFTLGLGTFDDTPEGEHAFKFYEKNSGKIKLSHMFNYPTSAFKNGVYYAYNTVEITTLPDGAEAFPYTSFEEVYPMTLTPQQQDFIKGVGGEEMLNRALAADTKAVTDTKTLESLGVQSKGLNNFENATIPAATGDVEALKTIQADFETRLKAVTVLPEQVKGLTDQVSGIAEQIKALTDQVKAAQQGEAAALAKANDLERQLQEYKDLKPPGSQAGDTLLQSRDKAVIEQLMAQAKADNSPSLVEKMVGGQPTIATGE